MPTRIHDPISTCGEDKLGRLNDAAQFLKRLADPECAPVVGLYGTWGTGKTSFVRMVQDYYRQARLRQSGEFGLSLAFVCVDAWLYEPTGNLVTPVMAKLQKLLTDHSDRAAFARRLRKVAFVTGLTLADIALRGATGGNYSLDDVDSKVEEVEKREENRLRVVDEIDAARDNFEQAVIQACEAQNCDRLAFIIDNLDRCFPDSVVALLESIKNIFSASDRCVWVLAVDPDVVASYITSKYQGTSQDGYSYLDKIVPEQFHLPLPLLQGDRYTLEDFLGNFLKPDQRLGLTSEQQQIIFQLPHTLIPRRLIKVARKYAELSLPGKYAFELILLYYCWPACYRWLSAENVGYIQGVLANFASPQILERLKNTPEFVELPAQLGGDRELGLFMRSAFELNRLAYGQENPTLWYRECQGTAECIKQAIIGQLRPAGLP